MLRKFRPPVRPSVRPSVFLPVRHTSVTLVTCVKMTDRAEIVLGTEATTGMSYSTCVMGFAQVHPQNEGKHCV